MTDDTKPIGERECMDFADKLSAKTLEAKILDNMRLWKFALPFPPSVNKYWRSPNRGKLAGRHLLSAEARAYRVDAIAACHRQGVYGILLKDRLAIEIILSMPDRRRRDIDNYIKAILDVLQHARVIEDDEQLDDLRVKRNIFPVYGYGLAEIVLTTIIPIA